MQSNLIIALIGCVLVCLGYAGGTNVYSKDQATTYSLDDLDNHWVNFKQKHGKIYRTSQHNDKKKAIFASNLRKINDHNKKYNNREVTYSLGTTVFADWHPDKFKEYVKKGLKQKSNMSNARMASLPRATAPASIDWRNVSGKSYVQAIKDQGYCGSCWAFSVVSAIESYAVLANGGNVPNLSEQNLVDCAYGMDGCEGGNNDYAWNYLIKSQAGGIATKANYPYDSGSTATWNGKCKYTSSLNSGVKVTGYKTLPLGDAALTQALGTIGPMTAYIYADSDAFQFYTKGVFTETSCPGCTNKSCQKCTDRQTDHAVMLEGYGTDASGNQYYILRNSWGTGWGMDGYMYIARGNNMLGVATTNFYPTVSVSKSTKPVTTTKKAVTTTKKAVTTSKPKTTIKSG